MEVLGLIIALIKREQARYDHRQFVVAVEVVLIDWIRDSQLPDRPTLVENVKEKGLAQRLIEATTKEAMAELLKDFAIIKRQELGEDEIKLLNNLRTTLELKLASPGESMILEDTGTIIRQQNEIHNLMIEVRDSLSESRNSSQNLDFDKSNQAEQPFVSQFVQDVNQQLNSVKKLIDSQRFDGARVLLEQLQQETAEREPDLPSQTQYRIYANWGAICQGAGEFEKAARAMIRAFDYQPDDPKALVQRAYAEVLLGRPAEGEPYISRALGLAPDDDQALLVSSFIREENSTYIAKLWEDSGLSTPELLAGLSFQKLRQGEFEVVRAKLEPYSEREALDPRLHLAYAHSIVGIIDERNPTGIPNPGYWPETNEAVSAAFLAIEKALARPNGLVKVLKHEAYSLLTFLSGLQGDLAAAEKHTRRVLAENPEDAVALQNLVHIHLLGSRFTNALSVIEAHPDAFEEFNQAVRHADILLQVGKQQEALELLEGLEVEGKDDSELASYYGILGGTLAALGRVEEGINTINARIEEAGETFILVGFRAQLKQAAGLDAEEDYRRAMELSEGSYKLHQKRLLAQYLSNTDKVVEAASIMKDLVILGQATADTLTYLRYAASANESGEVERVLTSLEEAGVPLTDELLNMKAFILERKGRYQEALDIFEELAKRNPDQPLYFKVAVCHYLLGESHYPKVQQSLETLNPIRFDSAFTRRAIELLIATGHAEQALDLAFRGLRAFPEEPFLQADFLTAFVNPGSRGHEQPEVVDVGTAVQFELDSEKQWLSILAEPLPGADDERKPEHAWSRALIGKRMGETTTLPGDAGGEVRVCTILSKYGRAFIKLQETHPRDFPNSPAIRVISVSDPPDDPLENLQPLFDVGPSSTEVALNIYQEQFQATLGVVGKIADLRYLEACELVLFSPFVSADTSWHTSEEFDAVATALEHGAVALDLSALSLLRALGLLSELPKWFDRLFVSQHTRNQLRLSLDQIPVDEADSTSRNRIEGLKEFVDSKCEIMPVEEVGRLDRAGNERTTTYGLAPVSTLLMAIEQGVALYTDDYRFSQTIQPQPEHSFGTPVLLAALTGRKRLAEERYHEAAAFLAQHRIRIGVPTPKTLEYLSNGDVEKLKAVLIAIADPGYDKNHAATVVAYAAKDVILGLQGFSGASKLIRGYLDAVAADPDNVREAAQLLLKHLQYPFYFLPQKLQWVTQLVDTWLDQWRGGLN